MLHVQNPRRTWYFIRVPLTIGGWSPCGKGDAECCGQNICPRCGGPTTLSVPFASWDYVNRREYEFWGERGCDACSASGICDSLIYTAGSLIPLSEKSGATVGH